jgi:hypothetical protein
MLRIEIIANHSVEENILEAFSREGVGKFYTKYSSVFGVGSSGPRMGDAVWPEENFSLVIWCEEDEARGIARAVAEVKEQFPDEGIRVFGIPAESNRFPHVAEPVWTPVHTGPGAPARAASPPESPPQPVYTPPQVPPAAPEPVYAAPPLPSIPQPAPQPPSTAPAMPQYVPQQQAYAPQQAAPAPPVVPGSDSVIGKEYDGQNMEN